MQAKCCRRKRRNLHLSLCRNANFFASRQCLYRLSYNFDSSSICNLFTRVCFSKKYQTGKNLLDQNSSSKHPHNAIRSTQHLTPVSRATSKWPIKICGTRLVLKKFYCFLPITVLHSLIIELYFLVFALCLLINCLQSLIFP